VQRIHQINLQPAAGGGEIFTRRFTRALADAGTCVELYVHPSNRLWEGLRSDRITITEIGDSRDIIGRLPGRGSLVITQSRIHTALAEHAARNHVLSGFAHMPLVGRSAAEFARYAAVFTVSQYCIGLLREAGLSRVYPEPVYGTGELDLGTNYDVARDRPIRSTSPYDWDKRKGRDRILSLLEPLAAIFASPDTYSRKPGLTLGIVSLLSPIKQLPALFSLLAPQIARFPEVNVEIFGNGGYAQVRDLKRSLHPISKRVRFWGYQQDIQAVYPNIDYLMTGLPEKEALGLNVLEAQALGTPVLAPGAPPFTETVVHAKTGFLYRDPREDRGKDFGELLESLVAGRPRPDPRSAEDHMAKFTYAAMVGRARAVVEHLESILKPPP
jgi:glycosyltransferase involved in cell wall biosynthesis